MNELTTIIMGIAGLIDAMVACVYAISKLIDFFIDLGERKNGKK